MSQKTILCLFLLPLLLLSGFALADGIDIQITEVMAANDATLDDYFGKSSDWVELYNPTDSAVSLNGVCLSDSKKKFGKFAFPADAVLEPGEYLIVFASDKEVNPPGEYHAPFKLSAAAETVYLTKNGSVLQSVSFANQETDISLALDADGQFRQTRVPTPGFANTIVAVENE